MEEILINEIFRKLRNDERIVPPALRWKTVNQEEYKKIYKDSIRDILGFWKKQAKMLYWAAPWHNVIEGSPPNITWFNGGRINAYHNIIRKHQDTRIWSKPAIIWEGEEGIAKVLSYSDLDYSVERLAASMKSLGVGPGDWVLLYSPPIIDAIVAMLASVKIGAPFEAVFTGYGYWELARRIKNRAPKLLFVTDGFYRRGKVINTIGVVRNAVKLSKYNGFVVVMERLGPPSTRENELLLSDLIKLSSANLDDYVAESRHPLFGLHIGYASDYRPLTHPTGGFLTQVLATSKWIGIRPRDTYFCTVWPGWITGISYVVFGPLMIGATILLYDGGPDYPSWDRWWSLIEDYAVTLFLTTGGALRQFSRVGNEYVMRHNIDTLRAILVTAEPLEADIWLWTYKVVGTGYTPFIDSKPGSMSGRIPVINLYIISEVGTFISGNLINYTTPPLAPGSSGTPIPGFHIALISKTGDLVNEGFGEVVLLDPWPSMPIQYPFEFEEKWKNNYFRTGDFGYLSTDGYLYILGRIDGVIKTSGYRLSPGAIERALFEILGTESIIIPCLDETRLQSSVVFYSSAITEDEVRISIRDLIGAISEPRMVIKVDKRILNNIRKASPIITHCNENEIQRLITKYI